eukprot:3515187-Rhodomonas_salina.2
MKGQNEGGKPLQRVHETRRSPTFPWQHQTLCHDLASLRAHAGSCVPAGRLAAGLCCLFTSSFSAACCALGATGIVVRGCASLPLTHASLPLTHASLPPSLAGRSAPRPPPLARGAEAGLTRERVASPGNAIRYFST